MQDSRADMGGSEGIKAGEEKEGRGREEEVGGGRDRELGEGEEGSDGCSKITVERERANERSGGNKGAEGKGGGVKGMMEGGSEGRGGGVEGRTGEGLHMRRRSYHGVMSHQERPHIKVRYQSPGQRRRTSSVPLIREETLVKDELLVTKEKVRILEERLAMETLKVKESLVRVGEAEKLSKQLEDQLRRCEENLKKVRLEVKRKTDQTSMLDGQVTYLEEKVRNVQVRAAEADKLDVMVKSLKTRIEEYIQDIRHRDSQLGSSQKELRSTVSKLQVAEKTIEDLFDKTRDLKAQVLEELVKNVEMDQKLDEMDMLRDQLKERDLKLMSMKAELDQKSLVLQHARQTLRQERESVRELKIQMRDRNTLREDLTVAQAEALTLKKLLIGKDSLLVQRTQALLMAKEIIEELDKSGRSAARLQQAEQPPRVVYPQTVNFRDPDREKCIKDERVTEAEKLQTFMTDPELKPRKFQISGTELYRQDNQDGFLEMILDQETENNPQKPDPFPTSRTQPGTNPLQPNQFPTKSPGTNPLQSNQTPTRTPGTTPLQPNQTQSNTPGSTSKPITTDTQIVRRAPNTAIVRPHLYRPTQTFSNFRVGRTNERPNNRPPSSPQIHRGQIKVKLTPSVHHRPKTSTGVTGRGWSVRTKMTMSRSDFTGSALLTDHQERGMTDMDVYERDALCLKFVHLGDRVVVDISGSKGKEELVKGIVRYVGEVDREVDDYRIYIGVKLDEPVGDTDGLYKGKRYFTCPEKNGKILRITRVKAVLHPKESTFSSMQDCINNFLGKSKSSSSLSLKSR